MTAKKRGKPPYERLVNRDIRFYFSDCNRETFRNDVERRQFNAVKTELDLLSPPDVEYIRKMLCDGRPVNVVINQIAGDHLIEEWVLFRLLTCTSKRIAARLQYISSNGGIA
jgi:hypothetical protein